MRWVKTSLLHKPPHRVKVGFIEVGFLRKDGLHLLDNDKQILKVLLYF